MNYWGRGAAATMTVFPFFYPSSILVKISSCDNPLVDETFSMVSPPNSIPTIESCKAACHSAKLDTKFQAIDETSRSIKELLSDEFAGCAFPALYGGDERASLCPFTWSGRPGFLVTASGNNIFTKDKVVNATLTANISNHDASVWTFYLADNGDCATADQNSIHGDGVTTMPVVNDNGAVVFDVTEFYIANYNVPLHSKKSFHFFAAGPANATVDRTFHSTIHTEEANLKQYGAPWRCNLGESPAPGPIPVDSCEACMNTDPKCHFCKIMARITDKDSVVENRCGVPPDLCLDGMTDLIITVADGCSLPTNLPDWIINAGSVSKAVSVTATALLVLMLFL